MLVQEDSVAGRAHEEQSRWSDEADSNKIELASAPLRVKAENALGFILQR